MKIGFLKKYLNLLNPLPPIGSLAVTDTAIRFLLLKENNKFSSASLRLPPGIVVDGKIKNAVAFKEALKNLHAQVMPKDKPLHVIFILPPTVVYTQAFAVPILEDKGLAEAAELNLQMISPIDFKTAYAGWQKIGESFSEGGKEELLGSFAPADLVNQFSEALADANFIIAAVEFPALALVRLATRQPYVKANNAYLVVEVVAEGIALMLIRNANLHFNHFHSWQSIQDELGEKTISQSGLKNFLLQDIKKVLNFYASRWDGAIAEALLSSSSLTEEITSFIETNFSIKVIKLTDSRFPTLTAPWLPVLGGSLRGLIPRPLDNAISLTNEPVQVQYWQARLASFTSLWSKISLTVIIFSTILFITTDVFLVRQATDLQAVLSVNPTNINLDEVNKLQTNATEFNKVVSLALAAKKNTSSWSVVFSKFKDLAGTQVILKTFVIDQANILITGSSDNEAEALAFKDKLTQQAIFQTVDLPLSNIKTDPSGLVNFIIKITLKI